MCVFGCLAVSGWFVKRPSLFIHLIPMGGDEYLVLSSVGVLPRRLSPSAIDTSPGGTLSFGIGKVALLRFMSSVVGESAHHHVFLVYVYQDGPNFIGHP